MAVRDDEQLLHAVVAAVGVTVDAVEVLARRDGRLVVRATVPAGREVVIKGSATAGAFAAEAAAVQILSKAGLPVGSVRLLSDGPPSIIALDWTPGRAVRVDDTTGVRRQVVDVLTRIHALPASTLDDGANMDLVARIDGWCSYALQWWSQRDGVGVGSVVAAERWYQQVRPLVAGRAGSLVLADGVPDHFIVGPDARVRLIDVADLQRGDPVMDLAVLQLRAPGVLDGVVREYRHAEVHDRHVDELLPFYVFLRALAAAEWSGGVLHDAAGSAAWLRRAGDQLESIANS